MNEERVDWGNVFYYDESSPSCLRWKARIYDSKGRLYGKIHVGDVAGNLGAGGYYVVQFSNKNYKCHRIVYELLSNNIVEHGFHVDHIDGDRMNNHIDNLRKVVSVVNHRNVTKRLDNRSGVVGVSYCTRQWKGNTIEYWRASWSNLNGKTSSKVFSIKKYGEDRAFQLACKHRKKKIEELNAQGAGYTERHGT